MITSHVHLAAQGGGGGGGFKPYCLRLSLRQSAIGTRNILCGSGHYYDGVFSMHIKFLLGSPRGGGGFKPPKPPPPPPRRSATGTGAVDLTIQPILTFDRTF